MVQSKVIKQHMQKVLSYISACLLLALLVSGCSKLPAQTKATTTKHNLDREISHAQSIGVAAITLAPIISQENTVSSTSVPLSLFSTQGPTQYYTNQTKTYQTLAIQVRRLEVQSTQQARHQATDDIQNLTTILTQSQAQGFIKTKAFHQKLVQVQNEMHKAQLPKDFQHISQESTQTTEALQLLGTANSDLTTLKNLISTMKDSNLDTTDLEQQSQIDTQNLRQAFAPEDFNTILNHLNAQITSAQTTTIQAIPYVGQAKLNQFQASIDAYQSYGGNPASYQQMHNTDTSLLAHGDYINFTTQIDVDMKSLQLPLVKLQITRTFSQLMNDAKSWGHAHQYHDGWDGNNYDEAYEYWNGTLSDIQDELGSAQTLDNYQSILNAVQQQNLLFNAEKADENDHTAVDQVHQSDLNLMKSFNISTEKVIVTSLITDEARIYQNGKLIRAIPVVTGVPEKPTPPGLTQIFDRKSPATFTSFDQDKNSPFYYPATHINYAMEYHVGEYYYHDSWWRAADDYGLGKKFPHYAPEANNMGTHGCINMSLDEAQWLWGFTSGAQTVYSIVY